MLRVLTSLKAPGPWLLGDQLTLADLHAAPIIGYFVKVAEGQKLLAEFPDIQAWWTACARRPSFARTEAPAADRCLADHHREQARTEGQTNATGVAAAGRWPARQFGSIDPDTGSQNSAVTT